MTLRQGLHFMIERCPHCGIANPTLGKYATQLTKAHDDTNPRQWGFYACTTCGGVTLVVSPPGEYAEVTDHWPRLAEVSDAVPERARIFLRDALASMHTPTGAVMLAASSIDAMLKAKGYKDGTLFARIEKAAADHAITSEMAAWAHEIRLDANDQRHADEEADLPTIVDAAKMIDFAQALAQFMFVLPARVERGRKPPAKEGPGS